jgi:hypothetical protein
VRDEWAHLLADASGATLVERAVHARPAPLGYYRLTIPGVSVKFGKVVLLPEAPRLEAANRLARRLARYGVPVIAAWRGYKQLGSDYALFLHEWIAGSFSIGGEEEVAELGRAIAHMHLGLRQIRLHINANRWDLLESLLDSRMLKGEPAKLLQDFMQRRHIVEDQLSSSRQVIHNDLHPGNVLFAEGRVAAFLDFEEAVHSTGNPLIDISWVLERFCFLRHELGSAEQRASRFLSSYLSVAPCPIVRPGGTVDCMFWRIFFALAILAQAPRPDAPGWNAEWNKFLSVLSSVKGWAPAIANLEQRFLVDARP